MKRIFSFFSRESVRIVAGSVLFAAALVIEHLLMLDIAALCIYILALLVCGAGVYIDAVRGILRRDLLDEKFLMSVASICAMIVGEWSEGCAVMLFFIVGEAFEHLAVRRSRDKIRSLMDICPDEATVIIDGTPVTVDADEVEVGQTVLVRNGERIPVDITVTEGEAELDTSAMTGEALPRRISAGCTAESGCILIGGPIKATALRAADDSGAQRILSMVEEANERKSREESFITSFSRIYTPVVVGLAVLLAALPPIFGLIPVSDSIYRALIFLVISCPCALVISVPMAFFGGIGAAASRGILFKGGSAFSAVASSKTVAFDKTGTLTSGEFSIGGTVGATCDEGELLALAAAVEYGSDHPIAIPFRAYAGRYEANSFVEISGRGAAATVNGARVAVGNAALMESEGASIPDNMCGTAENYVYVCRDGKLLGAVILSDTVKPEAEEAVRRLHALGIRKTLILSGDRDERVQALSSALGIDEAHGALMPEDKYAALERELGDGKVMYIGDGINDAPSLALADAGVAMGGMGSDSAKEAADLVIVSDNLTRVPEAIKIARKTLRIAKQNIVFALGVKLAIMVLGAIGIANMWLAVFADVGVAVLAILNSMRALATGDKPR